MAAILPHDFVAQNGTSLLRHSSRLYRFGTELFTLCWKSCSLRKTTAKSAKFNTKWFLLLRNWRLPNHFHKEVSVFMGNLNLAQWNLWWNGRVGCKSEWQRHTSIACCILSNFKRKQCLLQEWSVNWLASCCESLGLVCSIGQHKNSIFRNCVRSDNSWFNVICITTYPIQSCIALIWKFSW